MSRVWAVTRGEILALRRSPVRVLAVLAVLLIGWVVASPLNIPAEAYAQPTEWWIAGQGFSTSAAFGGLIACIFSASIVQDDRTRRLLEITMTTSLRAGEYVGGKLIALGSLLLFPGVMLALALPVQRAASLGSVDVVPYLTGFVAIYLPVVMFSLAFGTALGTMTQRPRQVIAAFSTWWFLFLLKLPLPEPLRFLDITGATQSGGFFELTDPESMANVPANMRAEVLAHLADMQLYATWGIVILVVATVALCVILVLWLQRRWEGEALGLIE